MLQVVVVPPSLHRRQWHTRLAGVELPGVGVEDRGPTRSVASLDEPTGQPIGVEPEVPSAGTRHATASHLHDRHRDFEQALGQGIRSQRRVGDPVLGVTPKRKHRRVPSKAMLAKHGHRPHRLLRERERGGAVSLRVFARDAAKHRPRSTKVLAEALRVELAEAVMVVAVTGDLMPGPGEVGNESGQALGHPTQHEEGRLDASPIEQLQQPPRAGLDPKLTRVPPIAGQHVVEVRHAKPVFEVDAQQIAQGWPTISLPIGSAMRGDWRVLRACVARAPIASIRRIAGFRLSLGLWGSASHHLA